MTVFDIVGPVMIGPSSSHTAGAVRIGRVARALLGQTPTKADIRLHGSFAKTYKGHGTDKALIGGILGFAPDDERIRFAPALAKESGLQVEFSSVELEGAHPNTALLFLTSATGSTISVQSASVGGGNILITQVNGMDVQFSGEYTTLIVLHHDKPGTIAAVADVVAAQGVNISNFRLSRKEKGGIAVMTLELDGSVSEEIVQQLVGLANITSATMLGSV